MSHHTRMVLYTVLYVLALICFLAATVNLIWPRPKQTEVSHRISFNLIALGLAFATAPVLLDTIQQL